MMALSLLNIPATSPTAPAAPPGVAPAVGAFDLLLPIANPSDPRHEPAPDGKQIGKDVPVDETETPNPLAWLTPSVALPVSPIVSPPVPQTPVATETSAVDAAGRPVSRPLETAKGEPAPPVAITPPSAVPPITPKADNDSTPITPLTPAVSPPPSPISVATPTTATVAPPPRAITAEAPTVARSITPDVSRPLPRIAGEASIAPAAIAPPATLVPVGTAPVPAPVPAPVIGVPVTVPTPPPVTAGPAPATTAPAAKSSGATSPREARLPRPVSRQQPSVALETRPAPLAPAPTTPRIAPAALVFADAIHRATRDDRGPTTPDAAALTALSDIKTHAVAATADDAQHSALDLRQEQWPARMIERIDALRDAANANDTSIRLIPDALGKIDVSLKRDGDTVAVHFTAQQAETRQLLAEAAPKLAELAEARGLKLSQSGADTAGQQQPRQQPVAQPSTTPRRADADDTESTDTRIA